MRSVMYSMTLSLDGFIAGPRGEIDWSAPDEELHRFHNERTRSVGAQLLGRRLYETMLWWETVDEVHASPVAAEFARIWKPIPKVVFSSTLSSVEGNARLATDSLAEEVARLRDGPDDECIGVGGARLAAGLIKLDLIDDFHQFVVPVILGRGTPFFPPLDHRLELELIETRTFASRVIFARYRRVRPPAP